MAELKSFRTPSLEQLLSSLFSFDEKWEDEGAAQQRFFLMENLSIVLLKLNESQKSTLRKGLKWRKARALFFSFSKFLIINAQIPRAKQ